MYQYFLNYIKTKKFIAQNTCIIYLWQCQSQTFKIMFVASFMGMELVLQVEIL